MAQDFTDQNVRMKVVIQQLQENTDRWKWVKINNKPITTYLATGYTVQTDWKNIYIAFRKHINHGGFDGGISQDHKINVTMKQDLIMER